MVIFFYILSNLTKNFYMYFGPVLSSLKNKISVVLIAVIILYNCSSNVIICTAYKLTCLKFLVMV